MKTKEIDVTTEKALKIVSFMKVRVNFIHEIWEKAQFLFIRPDSYDEASVKKFWKEESPAIMKEVIALLHGVETFTAGNVEKSRQLQFEALELVDALFCEVNPIPVKTALNLMGMEVGPLRMPLCEMEEANLNKLKTALKNYGLIK